MSAPRKQRRGKKRGASPFPARLTRNADPLDLVVTKLLHLTVRRRRSPGNRAEHAARVMAAAKQALATGRRELANATTPTTSKPVIIGGPWRPVKRALDESGARLLRIPGVVGVGLGFRRRRDVRVPERCVVVMVDRKRTPAALRRGKRPLLPNMLPAGRRNVPVDVVEVGTRLTRQADAFGGDSIGPRGRRRKATLGTFAIHNDGTIVALTAMHLFDGLSSGPGRQEVVSPSLMDDSGPAILGRFRDGSTQGIDAATIALASGVTPSRTINGVPIQGWRPLVAPGDDNLGVFLVGATTQVSEGFVEHFCCSYPRWRIEEAITVRLETDNGDSGAALLDRQGFVLGMLVGRPDRHDTLRVFCSIGSVLERLGCDIPS